jgi:hypothetical protein
MWETVTSFLPVPYVSQITSPGASAKRNDCGPACCAMILAAYGVSRTIDALYRGANISNDPMLGVSVLLDMLTKNGVNAARLNNEKIGDIYTALVEQKPVIAGITYAALVDAGLAQFTGFRGGHWVVVTGADLTGIYINDPYRTSESGKDLLIPHATWSKAWRTYTEGGDMPVGLLLIPTKPMTGAVPPSPVEPGAVLFKVNPIAEVNIRSDHSVTPWPGNFIRTAKPGEILPVYDTWRANNGAAWHRITPLDDAPRWVSAAWVTEVAKI